MTHHRYNLTLAAVLAPVVALLAATGAFLQPYDGGLTRLGGYPEAQYGWSGEQWRFDKPLYRQYLTREARYREPADVVVLGDSFTYMDSISWPNYLVQQTGLRVQGFRIDKTPLDVLLASDGFRERPPRVLIYQTVERELWARSQGDAGDCRAQPPPQAPALAVAPLPVEPVPYRRDTGAALLDFSLSIDFLSKVVPREYFGHDRTPVARLALARAAAFSSPERDWLLVYRDDLAKAHWTPAMWEQIRCHLVGLQNRVQANGHTLFVAMVAPDKLSAYAALLAEPQYRPLSRIDLLAVDPGLNLPRLDLHLQGAIRAGTVDVYLNNDTHWGAAGYRLVAEELLAHLTAAGAIAPGRPAAR